MATSTGTEVANGNAKTNTFLKDLSSLVIDYGRARFIDSERQSDGNNVPDRNDLVYGIGNQTNRDTTGGVYSSASASGGISPQVLMIGGFLVGGLVLLKVLKVI